MADLTYTVEVALGGVLTDVTDLIDGVACGGGRGSEYDAFSAGTCSFTIDDRTGDYVPGAGGLWSAETWIGRDVKVTMHAGGLRSVLWRGHVDDLDVQVEGFFFAGVTVTAVDPLALLARTELAPGTSFTAGLSSERVETVLALPEVATGYFNTSTTAISPGDTDLQADADASGNTLQYLQLVEQSEGGRLFIAHREYDGGVLTFLPRSATSGDSGLTFQDEEAGSASLLDGGNSGTGLVKWWASWPATWGTAEAFVGAYDGGDATSTYGAGDDVDGGTASDRFLLPYERAEFTFTGTSKLVNRVTFTREGGTPQTVEDADSQARYGIRSVSKQGLLNATDADVADLAGARIAGASAPSRDVAGLTVLLDVLSDDQASAVARTAVGDVVKVVTSPPGYLDNGTLTSLVRIEQVAHRISSGPSGTHSVTFRLTTLSDEFAGLVDGGTAATVTFVATFDGGTAGTVTFDGALDGGTAAFA